MTLLTKDQQGSYENTKICYICKKNLKMNIWKKKNVVQLEIIVIIQGNIEVLGMPYVIFSVPKKIPIVFHNGFNYDYHFTIKELTEELKKKFPCLGENTENYIAFTVSIEKEVTRIDKNGEEITKNIS